MEDIITRDLALTPKESDKDEGKAEENLEAEPKMDGTNGIIIEARPLSWVPAPDHDQLMPVYVDGRAYGLPEGWKVERRPRTSLKYIGKVDQYYYEPGTRRQFRSLKAVQRHLELIARQQNGQLLQPQQENDDQTPVVKQHGNQSEGLKDNDQTPVVTQHGNQSKLCMYVNDNDQTPVETPHGNQSKGLNDNDQTPVVTQHGKKSKGLNESSGVHSRKKPSQKRKRASSSIEFDFANPPEKVTWAPTNAERDQWDPIVDENLVPEAVKGLWAETFASVLHQKNKAPKP